MHSCVWPHIHTCMILSERELDLPVKAHPGRKPRLYIGVESPGQHEHLRSICGAEIKDWASAPLQRGLPTWGESPLGSCAPPAIHTASTSGWDGSRSTGLQMQDRHDLSPYPYHRNHRRHPTSSFNKGKHLVWAGLEIPHFLPWPEQCFLFHISSQAPVVH